MQYRQPIVNAVIQGQRNKLPPALRTLPPNVQQARKVIQRMNPDNAYVAEQHLLWAKYTNWYQKNIDPYKASPAEVMPEHGRELQLIQNIALSSVPFTSTDTVVLSTQVPIGYDGIIVKVVNMFTGTGFTEGSGDIAWRLKLGNKFARNLGNILYTYGSLQQPFAISGIGLYVVSNQLIQYLVSIPPASPVGGAASPQIICGVFGWFWPRD